MSRFKVLMGLALGVMVALHRQPWAKESVEFLKKDEAVQEDQAVFSDQKIQLLQKDIQSLYFALEEIDAAVQAYEKSVGGASSPKVDHALKALQDIQQDRWKAVKPLSEYEKISMTEVHSWHYAEKVNAAVNALDDTHPDAKRAIMRALTDFKQKLEGICRVACDDLKKKDLVKPLSLTWDISPYEELKDQHEKDIALHTSHDAIIDHHNEIDEHLQSLQNILEEKPGVTFEQKGALKFLEETHEKRADLLQNAQDQERYVTKQEIQDMQKDHQQLRAALGLLPQDTPQERALVRTITSSYTDLANTAEQHEQLHEAQDIAPTSDSQVYDSMGGYLSD